MDIHSTSKILGKIGGKEKSDEAVDANELDQQKQITTPKPKPSANPEEILSQILGTNHNKKNTPMD